MNTEDIQKNWVSLTLWQPWASLIALGLKRYETRSWSTKYRGKLLIHAAARPMKSEDWLVVNQVCDLSGQEIKGSQVQQYGCIVAIADLTQCPEMTWLPAVNPPWHQISLNHTCSELPRLEVVVGNWSPGRFAWKLENVVALPTPVPCKGSQRLWSPSSEVLKLVKEAIA